MMPLDLTPEEKQVLRDVLDGYLSDLSMEIADTDQLDYRNLLRSRKEVIVKTLKALQETEAAPTAGG